MGFFSERIWLNRIKRAKKSFEEQFGEPYPSKAKGTDYENLWPEYEPFVYVCNIYINDKLNRKEWYVFNNEEWQFVGSKNRNWCFEFFKWQMDESCNPGNVITDEQWEEVGVRMFFKEFTERWRELFDL